MEEEKEKLRAGRPSNVEVLRRETKSGSLTRLDELWKRKREEEEEDEEEVRSNRSKVVIRQGEEDKLGNIEKMMMEMKKDMQKSMEETRKQGVRMERAIKEKIEEMRQEMEGRERRWKEEKEELLQEIKEVRRAMVEQERKGRKVIELEKRVEKVETNGAGMEGERLKRIEWKLEMNERKEKRRNVVIKRLDETERGLRGVKRLLEDKLRISPEIEEVKDLGSGRGVVVTFKNEADKKEVMRKKKELRGRKEIIEDDMTWKERSIKWKLRQIAEEETRKGKRVTVRYGRIWIEGKWWKWDEEREQLKDWRGAVRGDEEMERGRHGEEVGRDREEE